MAKEPSVSADMTEQELIRRKDFLEFREEDIGNLTSIHELARRYADSVIDDFYKHLLSFEETGAFFRDPDVLQHVKSAQREYFLRLTQGNYDLAYAQDRLKIGAIHERIGLPMKAYLGMYNYYLRAVANRLNEAYRGGPPAWSAFLSLMKLTFLDMGLAIETYISSRERTIREQAHLLDLTHDCIFVRNMNDVITFWNRGAEELYGWSGHDAVGKKSRELLRTVVPEASAKALDALLTTDRWEGELIETRADGAQVVVSSRWALQRDDKGQPAAVMVTKNDITARKHREGEIAALNRKLVKHTEDLGAANKELESFAYSVSHDLRAPLRAMNGFSQMLEEDYGEKLDAEGHRLLGVIRANSERMGTLIDDLLAFSRLGRQPLATQQVQLEDLVQQTLGDLRPGLDGRKVEFAVGELGAVQADPALLRQALANLLGNAVKFTQTKDPAVVEVGRGQEPAGNGTAVYYVRDNGAGFDMKYYDKLFGVFQRLHSAKEFEGTGVGLAIVKRIIERHGGRVWAESIIGAGTTFYFTLGPGASG
jgi:PAS domain S-box-containing protein